MNNEIFMTGGNQGAGFQMVADFDGDIDSLFETSHDGEMPIIATRNIVLHPGVLIPIMVTRESTLALVKKLKKKPDLAFAVICQKDPNVDEPDFEDLYEYGVFGKLVKIFDIPGMGSNVTIVVQALSRCHLDSITKKAPFLMGMLSTAKEQMPDKNDTEYSMALKDVKKKALQYVQNNDELPNEAQFAMTNISNEILFINFMCTNLPFTIEEKATLLGMPSMKLRIFQLLGVLNRELQLLELKNSIRHRTEEKINEEQKEYFLRQQIKNIRKELGGDTQSAERKKLMRQAADKVWSKETEIAFQEELNKLDAIQPQSPDYNIQLTYLQQILALPWDYRTEDNLNLARAEKKLDQDHYGMEKVKERILEYISVLKLRGNLKSPILCLYGPPGVGKTSLGKSIAESLQRKYVRISLGGLHDESEIRGHRKTYIGAMPGRIIKGIQKAGSSNPVFILDEIDKVTQNTHQGDPASALLEVLDPEQNNAFHDNYLDMDYDLSNVMFIATANDISNIPGPLRDRMEMIEVSGYITEEKIEIAKRHLVKKEIEANGLPKGALKIKKSAIEMIIERYTRESGVRQLEKQIGKLMRKIAYRYAKDETYPMGQIDEEKVVELLGNPPFYRDIYQGNDYAGVVTGLAWTSVGGEILFIETSLSKGKAGKLTLTGNLGDVMKESATIALEYVKAHADTLNIDYRIFNNWNIHIHVPEGATPKDGPSAGITIATSIASALTQRKVRKNVAMTGEITLRGKVLPVGGIKEKILAAKRAGITDIIMCQENEKDILEITEMYLKGVTFHYVENVLDVWKIALTNETVDNPLVFEIDEEKEKK
jgi:ATP-dependent Lon protease